MISATEWNALLQRAYERADEREDAVTAAIKRARKAISEARELLDYAHDTLAQGAKQQ